MLVLVNVIETKANVKRQPYFRLYSSVLLLFSLESGSSASTTAPRVFVRDPDPGRSLVCLAAAVHNERRSKQVV